MRATPFLIVVAMLASACFSADARSSPKPQEIDLGEVASNAVLVQARDYRYSLSSGSARAGTVDFVVSNDASQEHEFVVVPIHSGRFELPLGELEPFEGGMTKALRAQLQPGQYKFVCLIVSTIDGEPRAHMARGMSVDFEVTP